MVSAPSISLLKGRTTPRKPSTAITATYTERVTTNQQYGSSDELWGKEIDSRHSTSRSWMEE
eukprot:scaffold1206_cov388-Prasinococcus_capsulatus_cf.AAC.23